MAYLSQLKMNIPKRLFTFYFFCWNREIRYWEMRPVNWDDWHWWAGGTRQVKAVRCHNDPVKIERE